VDAAHDQASVSVSVAALAPVAAAIACTVVAAALAPHQVRGVDGDGSSRTPATGGRVTRRALARAVDRQYAGAVELVVLAVRAGYLPAAAIAASVAHAPPAVAPALAEVAARVNSGERFADALGSLPRLLGPVARPLADSLAAADRYGLPLAPVLDRLASEARQQRRRQAEALARQLPVRLSLPLVLCTLPAFVLMAIVPLLLAAITSLAS
jgi:tight adherence protein C